MALRLEPGVIIKGLSKQSRLEISGALSVLGAPDNRITFTSINDQSFGDDRLNTASLGSGLPRPQDWAGVWFRPGGSGTISHADFRYSGFDPYLCVAAAASCGYYSRTIDLDTASLMVVDATFTSGWMNIFYAENSTLSISSSTLDGFPNPFSEYEPTIGVYAKRGVLTLDNVVLKNLYYGIESSSRADLWPAVAITNMTTGSFSNVLIPWSPAALLPL